MKYRHDYKEAQSMVYKAIRMSGRSMDMMTPTEHFKWESMAEGMIVHWKQDKFDYQLMVELEGNLVKYCQEALVEYVHELMLQN